MKEFMWKFVMYVANVHRGGTKESAGRFYGGLGLIVFFISTPIYAFEHKDPDILVWMGGIAVTLLLGKTAETVFKSNFAGRYGNKTPITPSQTT